MDYSQIRIAKKVLERAGMDVPESEDEIRKKAYEQMAPEDFLAAHSIRLRKDYRTFTREDWQEIIQISGVDVILDNIAATALCQKFGLIVL